MARQQGTPVLYIAGSGRSGSTLLERMIGAIPGYVNVGELVDLVTRALPGDELCGCGATFSRCAFWQAVGGESFGGWESAEVRELGRLQSIYARQRRIPLLALSRPSAQLRRYQDLYARLYSAISRIAGGSVVVDASKRPAQALALASGHIDLRVCHLTRDVRGVAWSMSRRSAIRPHRMSGEDVMFHRGMASAAAGWTLCQLEVDAIRLRLASVGKMRYETLMVAPRDTVANILRTLEFPYAEDGLAHIGTGSVTLSTSHGISGNPSRFREGVMDLRLDDEWRASMSKRAQIVTSALALPYRITTPSEARRDVDVKQ